MTEIIENDGWILDRISGSHHHCYHPEKKGIVTIPHPVKDIDPETANSIKKQTCIKHKGGKTRNALIPRHETRKYTISMDSSLMARIDAVTKNRSAFFAKAAEEYLGAAINSNL